MDLLGKRILLIMCGSVAVYKSLDLIRRMRERGVVVIPVITDSAQKFVTPLLVGAISNSQVYTSLFPHEERHDSNHIQLASDCDLFLVAPATAHFIACIAHGMADDLASAVLLAKRDQPVLLAPAMNFMMWSNSATQRNVEILQKDGYYFVGPENGAMAENNGCGVGRMSESCDIIKHAAGLLCREKKLPLKGRRAVVTSGPTYEPLDPMRYIANRSSGRQGHAIAECLACLGAEVTLISGPVSLSDPPNVTTIHVERAEEMLQEVLKSLPADIAVMVSAVSDWKFSEIAKTKIKRKDIGNVMRVDLAENPDILRIIGHHQYRPSVVVGFAAETQCIEQNAREKLLYKGADFIVSNCVLPEVGFVGKESNKVSIVFPGNIEEWPELLKTEVANRLCVLIMKYLNK
ncbi:bifunctional phosphopantothenoylcysteine decarboxylase/phosphopantothenate synthase [Candidatus Liberibacter solanacearum]|uniref:Coenzyme A biosynthesis bifunctional protein CoaBC n=1 Tax=Candidatus Liberibacter solanacearum TaxID=556287 RepID=A0A094ZZG8_9HYPH|nr:bifunctional phosphopantothenoylcysteine decarboxylase/phosphopantothenate--cysteine ligase CoaBC [Candidatus Liberibacter solanacearum]KGB27276.1 bifunctional phosphopantothenoylcysteine decarboxylase/phosphopantothenate synthase [Candidatus Liberibacter solanacearum]KJZ80857.1 bifunctional phosphopantothenoylcysteine decarboxylase/phosphopantothenate synthase [Candidatus Liberibacter solanacearum]KJZ81994.1 Phosphopantothenoylcysteine decarboxylase [Candidatus Liberibacter solanacearum]KQC